MKPIQTSFETENVMSMRSHQTGDNVPELLKEKIIHLVNNLISEKDIHSASMSGTTMVLEALPLIRVLMYHGEKTIKISRIFVDKKYAHQNIGKSLIISIYEIAKDFGYRLYLSSMLEDFYAQMVARGAKVIEPFDTLEVTDETDLSSHF